MCLMISAETVNELMEGANAAIESGDAAMKAAAAEKIQAELEGKTDQFIHYALLSNYCKVLAS